MKDRRRRDMVRQVHNLAGLCPQPMSDTGQVPPLSGPAYHHPHHQVIRPDLSCLKNLIKVGKLLSKKCTFDF